MTPAILTEPCPLCRSPETRVHYQLKAYRIAECRKCGFEFHDGFRGGGGDRDMFSAEYYTERHGSAFGDQLAGDYARDPSAPVYGRWLGEIASRLPGGSGRILDVGCALGTFLAMARDRGFEPHGVEISQFASSFAREKRGLDVFTGDLESYRATDGGGSFDVVTFWDAIEHVTHPLENLKTARRLLRPGGLLLLTTDNFDCLVADVARVAYRASAGLVRYAMQRVFIDANRSYFTEATVRRALDAAGFRIRVLEKMEYPIDKIRTNPLERVVLWGFYGAAALLHREAQVTVLAEAC